MSSPSCDYGVACASNATPNCERLGNYFADFISLLNIVVDAGPKKILSVVSQYTCVNDDAAASGLNKLLYKPFSNLFARGGFQFWKLQIHNVNVNFILCKKDSASDSDGTIPMSNLRPL